VTPIAHPTPPPPSHADIDAFIARFKNHFAEHVMQRDPAGDFDHPGLAVRCAATSSIASAAR
jgi:hypothetical protein